MNFNLADATPIVAFILSAIALATQVKSILSSGEKKLDERQKTAEKTLIDHDRRIQAIEGELKHLPDKDSVHKLQVDLTEMKGQISTMVKSSEATERATRRVEEFLINRAS